METYKSKSKYWGEDFIIDTPTKKLVDDFIMKTLELGEIERKKEREEFDPETVGFCRTMLEMRVAIAGLLDDVI